jgi:hypothetical protein
MTCKALYEAIVRLQIDATHFANLHSMRVQRVQAQYASISVQALLLRITLHSAYAASSQLRRTKLILRLVYRSQLYNVAGCNTARCTAADTTSPRAQLQIHRLSRKQVYCAYLSRVL